MYFANEKFLKFHLLATLQGIYWVASPTRSYSNNKTYTNTHSHMLRMGDKRETRNKHCARMRAQDGTNKHTLTNTHTRTRAITKRKNVMYTY